MAKRFLTPLNLTNLASDPESGTEGDLYYNTTSDVVKIYVNGEWTELQGGGGGGASVIYTEEQPDVTGLPAGTIWVDSDAQVGTSGEAGGGTGLLYWSENENGDLIPDSANLQSIGSSAFPVKEIYVSGSSIYLANNKISVEDGVLSLDGNVVITEANANDNLDLSNYLTLSTASSTYATKTELDEIDLTETINTASAAAYASASAYVDQEINALIGGAPETLDTLNEIASALEDNPEVLDLFLTKQEFAGASASFYRWTKTYSASATVIEGVDDNLIPLEYDEGYEQVFINGVMIEPSEYTRTSASVITLDEAIAASDVVDIFAYRNAFSTNTYTQAQIDVKYNSFSRWRKIYSASASVISGVDDNSNTLSYTSGYEQLYLNGILLTREVDYTATSSSIITLDQAIVENDVIEVLSFQPFNIADTYTQAEADSKFLTQSSASVEYLTQSSASNTYLTESSASATYLQQVYQQRANRNKIINGSMQVNQRATASQTLVGGGVWIVDRFFAQATSTGVTGERSTDVPNNQGFRYSSKFTCGVTTTNYVNYTHRVEGQNLIDIKFGVPGGYATISFWAKSSKSGTYTITFSNGFLTRPFTYYVATYNINNVNTWEYKTITIPTYSGSLATWVENENRGLEITFNIYTQSSSWSTTTNQWVDNGSTDFFTGSNAYNAGWNSNGDTFYITGIQLEKGEYATPFEFKPYYQELEECQRYYYLVAKGAGLSLALGAMWSNTQISVPFTFPIEMRTAPTLDHTTGTDYYLMWRNSGSDGFNSFNFTLSTTPRTVTLDSTDGVSGTAGQAGRIQTNNAASMLAFSAEL